MASVTSSASAPSPDDLPLQALHGLSGWLSPGFFNFVFKAISMVEVPPEHRDAVLTPQDAFFRRDRYKHPIIDPDTWRLQLEDFGGGGALSFAELSAMPQHDETCVVECAGNGNHHMGSAGLVGQGRFRGPLVIDVIDAIGGIGPATHAVFRGADGKVGKEGYHYGLSLDELRRSRSIVALSFNDQPLTRARGFPARLIAPGIYSMAHVKWLSRIQGLTAPHTGMHNRLVYVNKRRTADGWVKEEARWIGLKSLLTRCTRHQQGYQLRGQAWGGSTGIARVQVTTDGGQTWHDADVTRPEQHFEDEDTELSQAWATFQYTWTAPASGEHMLSSRAWGDDGSVQPDKQPADWRGYYDQVGLKWRKVKVP